MPNDNFGNLMLETLNDRLEFDKKTGRLISFRAKEVPDQELLETDDDDPVFIIQYLDEEKNFRQINSLQAKEISFEHKSFAEGEMLKFTFDNVADLDIRVMADIYTSGKDRFSYWSISVTNNAGILITDVQFPFIVVPYKLDGESGAEVLLRPYHMGQLLMSPKPQELENDSPRTWQFHTTSGNSNHYPGLTFAQFLAYYNDKIGVYISCQDPSGRVKLIKPVNYKNGIRLGIAHVGDWLKNGHSELGYRVVLGSFRGDWYDAADIYKDWSQKQEWAKARLHERTDIPDWLSESPPHIILRIQGELDDGPTEPNEEFLPYRKIIPLLKNISDRIDAPLVPVIMSWERPGPWIYPDCFPPAGGEESLHEFCELAREQNWHIGTFCNGTRWVIGHRWSGYNGEKYFAEKGGERSVSHTHSGELWKEGWDSGWRPSYACCLGTQMTHDLAKDFVQKIVDMGLDWIQFLDQNVGCSTFPCYADNHDHAPTPGRWMTEAMQKLIDSFYEIKSSRQIAFSVECPINEYFLQRFHICDVRVIPTGHYPDMRPATIPLYHYLYHEYILIQGGFGYGPEPYHLPIRNAYNLILGEIPGAVMKGDGSLLNIDTGNWAPWKPEVGSNDDALQVLKAATALRRGRGRDFLVYGRMLRPAVVQGISMIKWRDKDKDHSIPAVFHSAWQAPDGRIGVILANWTNDVQEVTIKDERLGDKALAFADTMNSKELASIDGKFTVALPGLSFVLLESF